MKAEDVPDGQQGQRRVRQEGDGACRAPSESCCDVSRGWWGGQGCIPSAWRRTARIYPQVKRDRMPGSHGSEERKQGGPLGGRHGLLGKRQWWPGLGWWQWGWREVARFGAVFGGAAADRVWGEGVGEREELVVASRLLSWETGTDHGLGLHQA